MGVYCNDGPQIALQVQAAEPAATRHDPDVIARDDAMHNNPTTLEREGVA